MAELIFDRSEPIKVENKIVKISDFKDTIVTGDHDSIVIRFKLNRYLENEIDLMETVEETGSYLYDIGIKFRNAYGSLMRYTCETREQDPNEEEYVNVAWIISQNVTEAAGNVSFIIDIVSEIQQEVDDGEDNTTTVVFYKRWQTLPCIITIKENVLYSSGSYDEIDTNNEYSIPQPIAQLQSQIEELQSQINELKTQINFQEGGN